MAANPTTAVSKLAKALSLGNRFNLTDPTPWSSSRVYLPGNLATTTGGVWVCKTTTSPGDRPGSSSKWWQIVGPPAETAGSGGPSLTEVTYAAQSIAPGEPAVLCADGETRVVPWDSMEEGDTLLVLESPASLATADGNGGYTIDEDAAPNGLYGTTGEGAQDARGVVVAVADGYTYPLNIADSDHHSYNFGAEAHIAYALPWVDDDSDTDTVILDREFGNGAKLLVTGQEVGNGMYEVALDGETATRIGVATDQPFDNSHIGDTIWAEVRYMSPSDPGSGPWQYAIANASNDLVILSAPPEWRPASAAANVILRAPSLTPEPGDVITTMWYVPSSPGQEANPEADPPTPATPPGFVTLGTTEWTGEWENDIGARVLLMIEGSESEWPEHYCWVTNDGFLPIEVNAGTTVMVGCGGAAFADYGFAPWVGVGGNSYFGSSNVASAATEFQPQVTTIHQVWMDGADYEGPLSGANTGPLDQALRVLDQAAGQATSGVTAVQGVGLSTTTVGTVDLSASGREEGAPALATLLDETIEPWGGSTSAPYGPATFSESVWNVGFNYSLGLEVGDYVQRAIVTYHTDGANSNVNVAAVLCDGSNNPLADTGALSGSSLSPADTPPDPVAYAGHTGAVDTGSPCTLTLIPDSPHYVSNPFDIRVQMRWTNGPGGGPFTVEVTDVTFVVERNNLPAFARRTGKWQQDEVVLSSLDDGTRLFDYGGPAILTITDGAVSDSEYLGGARLFLVDLDPGAGLVWMHRSGNSYDGEFINDLNERLGQITMATRTRPYLNVSVPSDHPSGDPCDFALPDLLDARYSIVQVWTVDEDGRRLLDPTEFRIVSWDTIRILSTDADVNYRIVAWGYFYDD